MCYHGEVGHRFGRSRSNHTGISSKSQEILGTMDWDMSDPREIRPYLSYVLPRQILSLILGKMVDG